MYDGERLHEYEDECACDVPQACPKGFMSCGPGDRIVHGVGGIGGGCGVKPTRMDGAIVMHDDSWAKAGVDVNVGVGVKPDGPEAHGNLVAGCVPRARLLGTNCVLSRSHHTHTN